MAFLMRRQRPDAAQLRQFGVVLLLKWVALGITIGVAPGISANATWEVLLAAVLLGLVGAILRPLLVAFAVRLGWVGVIVAFLLSQALLGYLVLSHTPGITVDGFWPAFWGSWIFAVLVSIGLWVVTAGDHTAVLSHLLRTTRGVAHTTTATSRPGVVFIQIDGLSAPLVQWTVRAGNLPTLSRWIRSGSHTMTEWHAQLPATTPASQAGLLHGASGQVPAFRWYEKESGRLVVTNRPRDSALVEERLSNGRGLLADGGVSVSNVFSGDAPTSLLTMSTVGARRTGNRPTRHVGAYFMDSYGFTRSLVLTIGEMVKEVYQSRRQRIQGIEPRGHRPASYVALRGVTNVLLRDLNLTLLAEHMMRGAPSIYCDFVDYDEIAHHAGPVRAESLASLKGIDGALATLEVIAANAPRPYYFVILSDHGQSQGATFKQRYGIELEDLVHQLTSDGAPGAAASEDEQWGRVKTFLAELGSEKGLIGWLSRRVLHSRAPHDPAAEQPHAPPSLVVVASGNLGMVYFADLPGRQTVDEIETRYPRVLSGLANHPGIGFIMVRSADGPIVIGKDGVHYLHDGRVVGEDPLARFGPHAATDLLRHDSLPHVGDIVINSRLDAATDEVAAFEDLVGCHGGLGGWQSRAVLVHPVDWPVEDTLDGSDAVHRQLIRWLERAGLRQP
jgi:uncharacterized membrane protein YvlD (DUF360 family)